MGAKEYKRINHITVTSVILVTITGFVLGMLALLFDHQLLSIYSSSQEVIEYGIIRMSIICTTYFTCGIMDVMVGSLRGMGYSIMPMIVSLTGACGLRVLWILLYFVWIRRCVVYTYRIRYHGLLPRRFILSVIL